MFTPSRPSTSRVDPAFTGTPIRTPVSHATAEDEALVRSALQDDAQAAASARDSSTGKRASSLLDADLNGSPRPSKSRRQSRVSDTGRPVPRASRLSVATVEASRAEEESRTGHTGDLTRVRKLDQAMEKFLGLVDIRATPDNFRAAFPEADPVALEELRVELIEKLKVTMQKEQKSLTKEYELDVKLAELQQLAIEADQRADKGLSPAHEEMKDVWRPNLDISAALHARSLPAQQERVANLEAELAKLEAANAQMHARLIDNMSEADEKQKEAQNLLDVLAQVVVDLELSPASEKQLRACFEGLTAELGPRA